MTEQTLARARAGDENAFRELTDPYRREFQVHAYRILGSAQDAEDLLQETLLAAWRGLDQFQERASVRAWLYRIATNRSLDALRASRRRPEDLQRMTEMPEPTRYGEAIWLEPFPDVLLEGVPDQAPGPEACYESKEAIALALIAGLQHLTPQQRVVLVLRDVLGFRAGEVAEMLDTTEPSVNSLLRRARGAFERRLPTSGRERAPLPSSKLERDIVVRSAGAIRVPRPGPDRSVPTRPHVPARCPPARPNPRQRATGIRVLLPELTIRARATVRVARPHAGGRPDIRDHLVRGQQRVPTLRTAPHPRARYPGAVSARRATIAIDSASSVARSIRSTAAASSSRPAQTDQMSSMTGRPRIAPASRSSSAGSSSTVRR